MPLPSSSGGSSASLTSAPFGESTASSSLNRSNHQKQEQQQQQPHGLLAHREDDFPTRGPLSLLDSALMLDSKNHDWRIANGEYILGADLKLQMLDIRVNRILDDLQHRLGIRNKLVGPSFDIYKRIRDKRLLILLEKEIKERLDDDALALAPSSWRLRERMKTVSVALVVCLNIGTDPPDVVKTDPCARLESWVDPGAYQPARALEMVARNLQAHFELWQPRARYKYILDPYVDQVKKLCTSLRRNAKEERVLFHFNGHGVPRPTSNGEIWVFNVDYTQYIPLSVYDLKTWVGYPAIYTFDCSAAGLLLPHFESDQSQDEHDSVASGSGSMSPSPSGRRSAVGNNNNKKANLHSYQKETPPVNECIVLLACGPNEILPSSPDFPADIFTSCLTTPMTIALRWFVMCNRTSMDALGITINMVDHVPGKLGDRKTPLGELNWIFTAITDTIAWMVLPRHLFRKLFRQDILVASLFRNFLLAERLLKAVNCNPQSYPALPPTWQHHLWQAWDMAVENCLTQLPSLIPSLYTQSNGSVTPAATGASSNANNSSNTKKSGGAGTTNGGGGSGNGAAATAVGDAGGVKGSNSNSCLNKAAAADGSGKNGGSAKNNNGAIIVNSVSGVTSKGDHGNAVTDGIFKTTGPSHLKTLSSHHKNMEVSRTSGGGSGDAGTSGKATASATSGPAGGGVATQHQQQQSVGEFVRHLNHTRRNHTSEETSYVYRQSDFFANQLSAFEVWLMYGENVQMRRVPEQLPIVLQVLLSSFHRQRALDLLARFLNLGSWAVSLALSVGIFPYVNKLLLSPDEKIRPVLIHIWCQILALDSSCQSDLVKEMNAMYQGSNSAQHQVGRSASPGRGGLSEGGHQYFVNQLRQLAIPTRPNLDAVTQHNVARQIGHSVRAAFVLSVIMNSHPTGQQLCMQCDLLQYANNILHIPYCPEHGKKLLGAVCCMKEWICYVICKLCERNPIARRKVCQEKIAESLFLQLEDRNTNVVQAAIFALSTMLGPHHNANEKRQKHPQTKLRQQPPQQMQQQQQQHTQSQQQQADMRRKQQTTMMMNQGKQVLPQSRQQLDNECKVREIEVVAMRHDCMIARRLVEVHAHGSPAVRRELVLALARLVVDPRHATMIQLAAHELDEMQTHMRQRHAKGKQNAEEAKENLDGELMKKLERSIGEHADVYLSVWLAIKRLDSADPFPAVSRTAAQVSTFVRQGVQERIEAIRSHAGLKQEIAAAAALPPAILSRFSRAFKGTPSPGTPKGAVAAVAAATVASGGAPGPSVLAQGATGVEQEQDGATAATQQQQQQPTIAADIIEQMGLSSTLYVRRCKEISLPAPLEKDGSWIPGNDYSRRSAIDPLGADGHRILSWHRRNAEAAQAASVLKYFGAQWAGLPLDEQEQALFLRRFLPLSSLSSSVTNSSSSGGGPSGGGISTTGGATISPNRRSFVSVDGVSSGVNGQQHTQRQQEVAACQKLVPPPNLRVQRRLNKLAQAGKTRGGDEALMWFRDETWAARSRAGLGLAVEMGSDLGKAAAAAAAAAVAAVAGTSGSRSGGSAAAVAAAAAAAVASADTSSSSSLPTATRPAPAPVTSSSPKMEQLAIFEHGEDMCSKVLFHPFEHALVIACPSNDITLWKYQSQENAYDGGSNYSGVSGNLYGSCLINRFSNDTRRRCSLSSPEQEASLSRQVSRVTALRWMNESSDPLLLVGSDDGKVRVWRDVLQRRVEGRTNGARMVTAWSALQLEAGSSGPGLVLDFQQTCGHLLCGGKLQTVSIWDMHTERVVGHVDTGSRSYTTSIASYGQSVGLGGYGVHPDIDWGFQGRTAGGDNGAVFVVGSGDGALRIFDKRIRMGGHFATNVAVCQNHRTWIVDVHVPAGNGGRTVCSGSVSGEIRIWDVRSLSNGSPLMQTQLEQFYSDHQQQQQQVLSAAKDDVSKSSINSSIHSDDIAVPAAASNIRPRPRMLLPKRAFQAHRSPMTAFVCHPFAPVFASGSHHQFIHVFNSHGDDLASIRYHQGFLKQRIGPVSALAFHPYKLLLAAGTLDSIVSVYAAANKGKP